VCALFVSVSWQSMTSVKQAIKDLWRKCETLQPGELLEHAAISGQLNAILAVDGHKGALSLTDAHTQLYMITRILPVEIIMKFSASQNCDSEFQFILLYGACCLGTSSTNAGGGMSAQLVKYCTFVQIRELQCSTITSLISDGGVSKNV